MKKIYVPDKPKDDGLQRTDWMDPASVPTIAGEYESKTAGGHIFKRKYDGKSWRNMVTGLPSTVLLPWRGIAPASHPVEKYTDAVVRAHVQRDLAAQRQNPQ